MQNSLVFLDGQVAKQHLANHEIKHHCLYISPQEEGAFTPFFLDASLVSKKEQLNRTTLKIDLKSPQGALLMVKGEQLIADLQFIDPAVFEMDDITKLTFSGYKVIAGVALAFIAGLIAIYLWVLPEVAESLVGLVSIEQEAYFGDLLYDSMLDNFEVDSVKSEALAEFAATIDFDTDYQLKYTVVKNNISNAFALPGGHIVVFDKLINETENETELAALLAHEVSHIEHQHSLKAMFRALAGYAFIAILLNDVNGLTTIIIDNANNFRSLAFSRELETEADLRGLEILRKNKIDQMAMVRLLQQISKDEDLDVSAAQFLSTHPITENRIEYISQEIEQNPAEIEMHSIMLEAWKSMKH